MIITNIIAQWNIFIETSYEQIIIFINTIQTPLFFFRLPKEAPKNKNRNVIFINLSSHDWLFTFIICAREQTHTVYMLTVNGLVEKVLFSLVYGSLCAFQWTEPQSIFHSPFLFLIFTEGAEALS